jgi:nucleoside-diphosphate-sugar epimerase
MARTTLIVGGTGAQGSAVARILANSGKYNVKILTRDASSHEAKNLVTIPNISIIEGNSYYEPDLVAALKGIDSIYVNTNGFAIGEKAETYWGIRTYELARREGVKHFVYAGLDYLGPVTNYEDKYHIGHYEGKGRVGGKPIYPSLNTEYQQLTYPQNFSNPKLQAKCIGPISSAAPTWRT